MAMHPFKPTKMLKGFESKTFRGTSLPDAATLVQMQIERLVREPPQNDLINPNKHVRLLTWLHQVPMNYKPILPPLANFAKIYLMKSLSCLEVYAPGVCFRFSRVPSVLLILGPVFG